MSENEGPPAAGDRAIIEDTDEIFLKDEDVTVGWLAVNSGADVQLFLQRQQLLVSNEFFVGGGEGTSKLTISNGTLIGPDVTHIGLELGHTGKLVLQGMETTFSSREIWLGSNPFGAGGDGELFVNAGTKVITNDKGIRVGAAANGLLQVDGGTVDAGKGSLIVGYDAFGTATLVGPDTMVKSGFGIVGQNTLGTVHISQGATWEQSDDFSVGVDVAGPAGDNAAGIVEIVQGGKVISKDGAIVQNGVVNVQDVASRWNVQAGVRISGGLVSVSEDGVLFVESGAPGGGFLVIGSVLGANPRLEITEGGNVLAGGKYGSVFSNRNIANHATVDKLA